MASLRLNPGQTVMLRKRLYGHRFRVLIPSADAKRLWSVTGQCRLARSRADALISLKEVNNAA